MLNPRVVVLRGGQVLAEHSLPPGTEVVVGRSEGCDVTVADGSVSRLHARLVADEEGVYVEDLGSANGTFVDGQRTRGRVRLADGQQVRAAQRAQSAPLVLRFEDVAAPAPDSLTAADAASPADAADETRDRRAANRMQPPPLPAAVREPLWRAGAPQPPVPVTVPVAGIAAATPMPVPPPAPAAVPSRRPLVAVLVVVVLAGTLAAAAVAAWWLLGSRRPSTAARAAATAGTAAKAPAAALHPSTVAPSRAAATSIPTSPEVLVVPVESDTGAAAVEVGATTAPPAAARATPLGGKWTARLENVFYPEDDYVVELALDLQQRGTQVSGTGQVRIENRAMTFGVPATAVSGTARGGSPSQVRIRLSFSRPIGELQLEGTLDGDALAGTFRSSTAKQAGAWQAVRAPG